MNTDQGGTEPQYQALRRVLRRNDVVLLIVGGVIGSGIFLVPGSVLRQVGGSPGLALLVWLLGGVLTLLGALTYGELGGMMPGTGGLYLYLREAFGRLPAFLYGWSLFLVISAAAIATLAVAIGNYAGQFLPLGPVTTKLVAIGVIAVLGWSNARGTLLGVRMIEVGTALKVGALALMIVLLPLLGDGFAVVDEWWPARWDGNLAGAVGLAMIAVLWAYEGWQYATFVAGEVIEPQRNLATGLALGTLALLVIYVLANLAYLAALGPLSLATSERVAADAVTAVLGRGFGSLVAVVIIISMLSAAQMILLTTARVHLAMARDGIFFAALARLHPERGTPARAVLALSGVAAVLAAIGSFEQLLSAVVFTGWIFYGLGALAVPVLRRRRPEAPRPFRVPGYPLSPLLFVAAATALVGNAVVSQPVAQTVFGLGVVATGVPAYLIWKRAGG